MILRRLRAFLRRLARPRADVAPDAEAATSVVPQEAGRVPALGMWTWNLASGALQLSPEAERILAQPALDGTFAAWLRFVDPADAETLRVLEDQVRGGQEAFSFEYRFRRGDGSQAWLKSDGQVVALDAQGAVVTVAGTLLALDGGSAALLSAERRAQARLRPPAGEATWTWQQDASLRFTSIRGGSETPAPALAQALGCRRWELPQAVPLNASWQDHIAVLERREPFRGFEYRMGRDADAVCVSVSGEPCFDADGRFTGYRGTASDITARVRAQAEATHLRLLLQQASRLGHLGAWALCVPGMQMEWTPECAQLLGRNGRDAPAWQDFLAAFEPLQREALAQAVAGCIAQGGHFDLEARALTADGQAKWVRILGEPEPSLTGPAHRVIGALQDISARKEESRRLQELNERLTNTLESITEGFYTLDRQWRFTYLNHETERVAQRPRAELLGRSIAERFPWFPGSAVHREYELALAEGRPRHFESFSQAMGLWVEVRVYPSPEGLAVYFRDITGQRSAQLALRASEERLRLMFAASLDAIFQLEHASGRFVAVNPEACRMFRLPEAELLALGRDGIVPPGEHRLAALLAQVDATGRGRAQLTLLRGDGTRFEAELSGAVFSASDGVRYASVFVRDLSELLQYQAQILALNEGLAQKVRERTADLEAANAELKGFAHSLAHDLRTPIAAINVLAHVLEERLAAGAERERHYAGRIRQAGAQLDAYVEALLSHARISQVPMRQVPVDLSVTVEAILADLHLREPQRTVQAHVQPGLAAVGDPALVRMALENLVGNAWKFTRDRPDAQIWFTGEAAGGWITCCVRDNGAGFDMEYAHKLFGTFQRLHTQSEFPGTGIGLANVQRIVARHGGRVWATGQAGHGASFCFTLPQQAPPTVDAPEPAA